MSTNPTAENVQRLVDEYLGVAGSAAIATREGELLFVSDNEVNVAKYLTRFARNARRSSSHDLMIESLSASFVGAEGWYAFRVSIDEGHVLFVVAEQGILPAEMTTRIERAVPVLRRVFRAEGSPDDGGDSGAPAEISLFLSETRRCVS